MVHPKTLAAAVRRRRDRKRPLPLDNQWLRLAEEKLNPLPLVRAVHPPHRTLAARVHRLLLRSPMSVERLVKLTGSHERAVRSALDSLRNAYFWPLLNVKGRFLLDRRRVGAALRALRRSAA